MPSSTINAIIKKEFLEVSRDRKTLIFAILLPVLAFPVLIYGFTKFTENIIKQRAVNKVTIVASSEDQAKYEEMVHLWFRSSEFGRGLEMATNPLMRTLVSRFAPEDVREQLGTIPPNLMRDPQVFSGWAREQADAFVEALETADDRRRELEAAGENILENIPDNFNIENLQGFVEVATTFYDVTIKGLGLVDFQNPDYLLTAPANWDDSVIPANMRDFPNIRNIAFSIQQRRIQGYLIMPEGYDQLTDRDLEQAEIIFVHDSTIGLSGEAANRVRAAARAYGTTVLEARLKNRELDRRFMEPISVARKSNLASPSRQAMAAIGGFLPYIIIVFAFMGGMFPALDLGAGEKERNTLETLLLSPPSRMEIAVGKFMVILICSLAAAIFSVISLGVTIKVLVPEEILTTLDINIPPSVIFMMAVLTVPIAATFAGLLFAISIFARTFKEAQNYTGPITFILFIPAIVAIIPDIELNTQLALVPLVNVSLVMREFVKGDINLFYFFISMLTSGLVAFASIGYAVWQFGREEVLFRT